MKYKTLLIKPINKKGYQVTPDFGIGYVAAALLRNGHAVTILDCPKEKMNLKDFEKYIHEYQFDVIGFKILSSEIVEVKKQIEIARTVSMQAVVVVGGPHASAMPIDTFKHLRPDYLFTGEAEIGFIELLRSDFKKPEISPGLVWDDGVSLKSNQKVFAKDIDQFGIPAWDLMNPGSYPDEAFGLFVKRFPSMPIITSRGCPFSCTFCAASLTTGKKIRRRSIELVIKEIRLLKDKYGVRDFGIMDDSFTSSKSYVIDLCRAIITENLDISWSCPNGIRLDTLNNEMLMLMEKAGCYSVAVGIESGSQDILNDMQKQLTIVKIREAISQIKKNTNIKVTGFFIIGYPTETVEHIERTINLALSLNIDRASFSIFSPLPGSPIFHKLDH